MYPQQARLISRLLWVGCVVMVASTALPSRAQDSEPTDEGPRFSCQVENGQSTVMYSPKSRPGESYPWAVPTDMGSAWPAERRCSEISRRLELYRPDGLNELQVGVENGYNTVCVTTEQVPACRIVFTVPPGQDPLQTRDAVFQNIAIADNGTTTSGVNTLTNNGSNSTILDQISTVLGGNNRPSTNPGINLKPFLDAADGGTGTQLNTQVAPPRVLNPNNF